MNNPFPGLRPFHEGEEHLFFGRENQVDAMVDKLASTHFLAVVGTSGSGKSSLVNCGLRPALRQGLMARAGTAWRMAQFRPGSNPLQAMANALAEDGVLFRDYQASGLPLADIVDTTLRMSKLGLIDMYEQARLDEGTNLLVVVDQFEELFRYRQLGAGEEATAFVNLLLEAGNQTKHPIYVVLTMRSDFLGDCTHFPGLAEAINAGQYLVPRMTRDERREAISGPAGVGGAKIAPVLLTRLVNDVGDNPDQLSILQHAMNRTWAYWENEGSGDGSLDLTHYKAIGTMAGALDQHAERAYDELDTPRQYQLCEKIFKALTDKATDPRGVRRPTKLSTLCALADATITEITEVIEVFRKPSRSFLMPPVGEALGAETVIDISHESLMRVWKKLDEWAKEEAQSARIYRRLADDAMGQVSLWRDPELQQAINWRDLRQPNEVWASRYHPGYAKAMCFLTKSIEARETMRAEREEQSRRELKAEQEKVETQARYARRMRWAALFSCALAVIAIIFYVEAMIANKVANEKTRLANSGRLANISLISRLDKPDLAALLAIEAMNTANIPDARNALFNMLQTYPGMEVFLRQKGEVTSLAFSPKGGMLVSGSDDGTVRLWQLEETGVTLFGDILSGHTGKVNSVSFAPDGKTFASGGRDSKVRIWRIGETGAMFHGDPLAGHNDQVWSIAFASDEKTLASGSSDKTIQLWRLDDDLGIWHSFGDPLTLAGRVNSVAFAPDGKILASGSGDGKIRLWRLGDEGAEELDNSPLVEDDQNDVWSVAFPPAGKSHLVSGSSDGKVRLWRLDESGAAEPDEGLNKLTGHKDRVTSVAFAPNGETFVSGGSDGTVRLWQLGEEGVMPLGEPLTGHNGRVTSVAFASDGTTFASGGWDKTLRLWHLGEVGARLLSKPPNDHEERVTSIAFAPEDNIFTPKGNIFASGSKDKKVMLWRLGEAGATPFENPIVEHKEVVRSIAFAPNGLTFVSGVDDGTVQLWDLKKTGAEPRGDPENGHKDKVNSVAFAPNGKIFASGSSDGTVQLWHLKETGAEKLGESLKDHEDRVWSVAFSPDGRTLASGGQNGKVLLWRLEETGAKRFGDPLISHTDRVTSVAFAPKRNIFASVSGDGTVQLWQLEEMGAKPLSDPLKGHKDEVWSIAFASDNTFATGSWDNTVQIWRLWKSSAVPFGSPLKGHKDQVWSVAFAPDGRTLASGGEEGTVQLWQLEGSGTTVSDDSDNTVRLWNEDVKSWLVAACRLANRNFSLVEWQRYMGEDKPYRLTCTALPPGEGVVDVNGN